MDLPYIDVHVPASRFRQEQIDAFEGKAGVLEVVGIDESASGVFNGVRITFSDVEIMQRYLDAGLAAIAAKPS